MKKTILTLSMALLTSALFSQSRYLDEVFTNAKITSNVQYGQNYSFLTGAPVLNPLLMDVYEPEGDWIGNRPLIIYLHTGSFLPILINGTATGDMHDSATVEMCKQFARRGYVVVSMDYRLGWNPLSGDVNVRTGTLLQAVYRSVQDTKTCVRYFMMTAKTQSNPWRIDTNKIILGGQGTGGYIVLAYATLHDPAQLTLAKFVASGDAPLYGIYNNQPFVIQDIWGDFDGFGGVDTLNYSNWPGYTNNIDFVFNMGGAMGDSSWLQPGNVPMVCFHVTNDPFAPYGYGPVIVPTTGDFVVDVSGSHDIIKIADAEGNNNSFNLPFNDPYTQRANQVNEGLYGLFPFVLPDPGPPFHGQAGPWEWWNLTALEAIGGAALADPANAGSLETNPDMSKTKALHYIDTIQGYLNPRIVASLNLDTMHINIGVAQVNFNNELKMFPNPAVDFFTLQLSDASQHMEYVKLFDITGRLIMEVENIKSDEVKIAKKNLAEGLYSVKIGLKEGELNGKIVIQ
jgi:hypothetical protein